MTIQSIAVGIDERPQATDALAWAAGLAHDEDASLRVVHVWQTSFNCINAWATPSADDEIRHADAVVRDALTAAGLDRTAQSTIVRGNAGPALMQASTDADLVVIGRTDEHVVDGEPSFSTTKAGATARYCIDHTSRAIATVPARAVWVDAPQVVVGIDGSPTSLAALQWAMEHLPTNASIHAVQAVSSTSSDESGLPAELLDPVVGQEQTELRRLVDANVIPAFAASGRTVGTHIVHGYATDALTEPGIACDLIVVGEHGQTAKPDELGSVADHTLRHSDVPVIIVPSTRSEDQ